MVTFVNAILGGVTIGLMAALVMSLPDATNVIAGIVAGAALLGAGLIYDATRVRPIMNRTT
jgi:hypothetical protein